MTSIGWYLSAHPGGVRFESCHWEGDNLVLGYTYGSGDTVSTMVHPAGDHVVAQLRVDEGGGDHTDAGADRAGDVPDLRRPAAGPLPERRRAQLPGPLS